jgi:GWxTD domain-containing protein
MPMNPAQQRKSAPSATRSASILAAILVAFAGSSILPGAFAQSPSTDQRFVAGDDAPTPLAGPYRTWLDQDVRWIIAPTERSAYRALETDPDRLQFIQDFWERRNPVPGSSENMFKEEHYRRLAYANQRFTTFTPGWMSDRGHVYIVHGKPDSIDAHPTGASGEPAPFEIWHYNMIHTMGTQPEQASPIQLNVDFKFVDTCQCGDYTLASPLLYTPIYHRR